jgi:hypothetical protein
MKAEEYKNILVLKDKYSSGSNTDSLFAFYNAFRKSVVSRQQSVIDLIVVAANLGPEVIQANTSIDPLLEKAIRETNPGFDTSLLNAYSENELKGIVNSAKGKYFEYLVVDKLNAGETIGDLSMPEGYQAVMASSATQPGWDIQIIDTQGSVSEYLQLKATNSFAYIREALEKYPDIRILATDEIAEASHGLVLDSDITEASIRAQVLEGLDGLDTTFAEGFWDSFHPLMPLVFILATEGYRVTIDKYSLENAVKSTRFRFERAVVATGIGALVIAVGGGWLSLPASVFSGILYNHYRKQLLETISFKESTNRLRKYRIHQQKQFLERSANGFLF